MKNLLAGFEIGNASDVGLVRKVNEDYYGTTETLNGVIVLVCDGMGGHAGGETASRLAVESIVECLNAVKYPDPRQALGEALGHANQVILGYAREHPELRGMGTTCVALLIGSDSVCYAHVGDSRLYIFTGKQLQQLTKDHSFVQGMVDAGALTPKEAENHPRKNEITNALGLERMQPPTVCREPYEPGKGDLLLLCTDGLTGMVSDKRISGVLRRGKDLYTMSRELVALANEAGGKDNITVQIVRFTGENSSRAGDGGDTVHISKRTLKMAGLILLVLALLGVIGVVASGRSAGGGIVGKIKTMFRPAGASKPAGNQAPTAPPPPSQQNGAVAPAGKVPAEGAMSPLPKEAVGVPPKFVEKQDSAKSKPVAPVNVAPGGTMGKMLKIPPQVPVEKADPAGKAGEAVKGKAGGQPAGKSPGAGSPGGKPEKPARQADPRMEVIHNP